MSDDHGRNERCQPGAAAPGCWSSLAIVLVLALAVGACARGRVSLSTPPDWVNSVITAREPVNVTPAMSMAERLTELRRAKEAVYQRLIGTVYALPLTGNDTIASLLESRSHVRPLVESFVRRAAMMEPHQQQAEIRATLAVGVELLDLLEVKQKAPPVDRQAPSTGIVRPY